MKKLKKILLSSLFIVLPVSSFAQKVLKEFNAPGTSARGMAWDGQYLWCADAAKDSIFKIDPATEQVVHAIYFAFNASYGGGITWGGDEALWVTRVQYFYKLDANTGQQLTNFHCPGG